MVRYSAQTNDQFAVNTKDFTQSLKMERGILDAGSLIAPRMGIGDGKMGERGERGCTCRLSIVCTQICVKFFEIFRR